jgi:regulator of protease activity HflC (stomatin/prohibitin superfamily)
MESLIQINEGKSLIQINGIVIIGFIIGLLILFVKAVEIVRSTEVGLIERFGEYVRTLNPGLNFLIPFVERVVRVNMTETMVDVEPQTIITKDKLNVKVDGIVYYKVNDARMAIYNVDNFRLQLVALARTTLRAVIGQMTLTTANENRSEINSKIEEILEKETQNYGVDVLRVEIQKIEPPVDVIESMNTVVKAEQEKIANEQLALAQEIKADGERKAAIKQAEGIKQAIILKAEAEKSAILLEAEAKAKAIELVNKAAQEFFKDGAAELRKIEMAERVLQNGTKMVVPTGTNLINLIGELANLPIKGA